MLLVIRPQQMDALGAAFFDRSLRRLAERLKSRPARVPPADGDYEAFVRRIAAKADTFDVDSEEDLLLLGELALESGEDFWERPEFQWFRDAVDVPGLPGWARMANVRESLASREMSDG